MDLYHGVYYTVTIHKGQEAGQESGIVGNAKYQEWKLGETKDSNCPGKKNMLDRVQEKSQSKEVLIPVLLSYTDEMAVDWISLTSLTSPECG